MRNPKTTRKMSDFRIFCELLAKMMLESIDFTDVLEGYRRKEKPEKLGIATVKEGISIRFLECRKEKPEKLGIATTPYSCQSNSPKSGEKKSPK